MTGIEDMHLEDSCKCDDPDCGVWSCNCGSTDVVITGCFIMTETGPIQVSVRDGVVPQPPSDGEVKEGACVIFVQCSECERLSGFGLHESNGGVRVVDSLVPVL